MLDRDRSIFLVRYHRINLGFWLRDIKKRSYSGHPCGHNNTSVATMNHSEENIVKLKIPRRMYVSHTYAYVIAQDNNFIS